ncbi:hypothetical protein LCGC14_0207980 [marine sediment metagenome]|uniref:Uncharacterized protein n=1 Tax=marine sediment metagenome TaxID=412755 RepID=A0A0F9UXT5_9ZZZZ
MSRFKPSGKAMTKDMLSNLVKAAMKRKPEQVKRYVISIGIPGDTAEEITEYLWGNMPPGGVGFMDAADESRFNNNTKEEK